MTQDPYASLRKNSPVFEFMRRLGRHVEPIDIVLMAQIGRQWYGPGNTADDIEEVHALGRELAYLAAEAYTALPRGFPPVFVPVPKVSDQRGAGVTEQSMKGLALFIESLSPDMQGRLLGLFWEIAGLFFRR